MLQLITIACGWQYTKDGDIVVSCAEDRYITCSKCNGRAEVTPIGILCLGCSFRDG